MAMLTEMEGKCPNLPQGSIFPGSDFISARKKDAIELSDVELMQYYVAYHVAMRALKIICDETHTVQNSYVPPARSCLHDEISKDEIEQMALQLDNISISMDKVKACVESVDKICEDVVMRSGEKAQITHFEHLKGEAKAATDGINNEV